VVCSDSSPPPAAAAAHHAIDQLNRSARAHH
jgi:hypothetical protein